MLGITRTCCKKFGGAAALVLVFPCAVAIRLDRPGHEVDVGDLWRGAFRKTRVQVPRVLAIFAKQRQCRRLHCRFFLPKGVGFPGGRGGTCWD
jgi:hypothetical protein